MNNDTQSRKYQLTINNPQEHGITHETIKASISTFTTDYFCMSDEIGDKGTPHTHVFIYSSSPIRFSTIKTRFPTAHIENVKGSIKDNRDYILKTGKWEDSEKAETSIPGTFEESGPPPDEANARATEREEIIEMLKEGKSVAEVVIEKPKYALHVKQLEDLRNTLQGEEARKEMRQVIVIYIFGATGTGKTRSVYEENNPAEICRITTYRSSGQNFDGYTGQQCLVFEEFRSQIPLGEMLTYLDIYPLYLPARYSDRVARYTKVYILSNLSLSEQYLKEQYSEPQSWDAFLRRISEIREQISLGQYILHDIKEFVHD